MGSFSASLTGLEAASQDLLVISNNLANLDTTAYKNQEANFQDFFYQMLGTDGAGNPTQIGAGSIIGSVISAFTQGTINTTGVPTDMAIQGNGFFLEQNGGTVLYSRAGNFSQNASGFLVASDGGYVLGYPAVNGVISPAQTLAPLQISSGQLFPPNATTNVELTMNLDAAGTSAAAATGTLTATGNATNGDTITIGGTTYTFVTALSTPTTVPYQILIGATEADTLSYLVEAINKGASGKDYTTDYSTGTQANGQVTASLNGTTVTLTATSEGSAGNNIATTVNLKPASAFGAAFGATTLTGGVDDASFSEPVVVYDSLGTSHTLTFNFTKTSAAAAATGTLTATGNASANDTVAVGGTTYTFVTAFTGPNQILIGTTEADTLSYLAAAINGGAGAGTNYSNGTTAIASVTATSGASTLSLAAKSEGSAGNNIATTVGANNSAGFGAAFGATTLTGGTNNGWTYQITVPAADVTGATAPVVLSNGTLQFDGSGQLISPTADVTGISVTDLKDGAKSMNLTWQIFDPTTGAPDITQVAGSSNVSSTQQNGYASGALQSFTINSSGTIQGIFSNGQTLTLGQVALASFQNTQGLQLNGGNTYLATLAAGLPSVGAPGAGGRGTIVGQSLESSNADMTTELATLIVAERNYQANARAISIADQMLNYVLTQP